VATASGPEQRILPFTGGDDEPAGLRAEVGRLRAENARLLRLLELSRGKLLRPKPAGPPLLAVATDSYVGEGFDCPPLDTLFLAAPVAFRGRLVQHVGRVLRPYPGKTTAEIHDYHDVATGVLASSLAKRAPGYTSLGFPRSPPPPFMRIPAVERRYPGLAPRAVQSRIFPCTSLLTCTLSTRQCTPLRRP
jgi:hypothetical protein